MSNKFSVEMNSVKRDSDFASTKKITPTSPVVEVFAALTDGKSLDRFGKKADAAVKYIEELAEKAQIGDSSAVAELNTIRRYAVQPVVMKRMELLGIFGDYENIGYDETIERSVTSAEGELSRYQAARGDVPFGFLTANTYNVPSVNIAAGYAVDYRKLQFGDMTAENILRQNIVNDIWNKAARYAIVTVYNAIKNATGIKYFSEAAGITKTVYDGMLNKIRPFGKPNTFGDYSVVSQLADFATYTSGTYYAMDDAALEEIRKTGFLTEYKGGTIYGIPNAYDFTSRTSDGANFNKILPEGLLFIVPTGVESPIKSWTRGGLTSFTGRDVATGKELTRYDLEIAVDVAKGREYEVGLISDTTYEIPTIGR